MRDLSQEYTDNAPDLAEFFAGPPRAVFEAAPAGSGVDMSLLTAINRYQAHLGASGALEPGDILIVTGQQPGLFIGPLYTVYKAATAVRLAETLTQRLGRRCVPVFWIAGDDHDFEEARAACFLTKRHEPLALRYEPRESVDGLPLRRIALDEGIHTLIDRAAAETPGSELSAPIAEFLHETAAASDSLAEWTARLLARLFADTPLALFSPDLPEARVLAAPLFEREIRMPGETGALLNEAGARLEALGFRQQVAKGAEECSFFVEFDGRRRKTLYQDGRFVFPEEGASRAPDELLALLRDEPERFSPNVALRCVVQQRLLSPRAYVAGPGELAYWAQLKPVFERFGEPMPIVYPRARAVLLDTKLRRLMERYSLAPGDLAEPADVLLARALSAAEPLEAQRLLRAGAGAAVAALQELARDLEPHSAVAAEMTARLADRTRSEVARVETAVLRADTERVAAVEQQLRRLCNALAPWRKPQERVYTVCTFLFRHGWELGLRLCRELDIESFGMNLVEL